ncbi:Nodule inception protein [Quillaja saponaria]|uniref:Nodule inception protein n=1 Tax=Quillaja saponaria TaxID=32244 RepID=A0AAD7M1L4_QUISA|nr:Nodule inception protein [Quillaja saponaria]
MFVSSEVMSIRVLIMLSSMVFVDLWPFQFLSERSGTCLGVVEIVMTNQKINHRPELENVCHALEAVDFRSSQNCIPPSVKVFDELYQAALTEILDVLTSVCETHRLPLALTWVPCAQQCKGGCRHSNENYVCFVSTVDTACFVGDLDVVGVQESCSEYHLFRGQGIVGTAFQTSKPCFATDITAFSKSVYPLAHHARMFGLHAAVAIPIRSIYTGSSDFVLEFFLPRDCHDTEEQKQMLNSLSVVVQQACRSLHVVMEKEVGEELMFPVREVLAAPDSGTHKEEIQNFGSSSSSEEPTPKESSWIAHMMEAQKGKGVSVSLEYLEEPKEEFKVTTHWDNAQGGLCNGQVFSDFGQLQQSSGSRGSVEGGGESYTFGGRHSSGGRKSGEKRRTKAEKTISLPVLQQYFAGSPKDAAKSIGVCPTTLKRICRQHGITRWPSRKIKKVGHSLKKLQLVIDSVQGAEGAIQIGSFY